MPDSLRRFSQNSRKLLKSLHEVKDELNWLGLVLYKNRVRIRRYSWILPVIGILKMREGSLKGLQGLKPRKIF